MAVNNTGIVLVALGLGVLFFATGRASAGKKSTGPVMVVGSPALGATSI